MSNRATGKSLSPRNRRRNRRQSKLGSKSVPPIPSTARGGEVFRRLLRQRLGSDSEFIKIALDATHVYLSGQVRSYHHKQLAQESIRQALEGREMINTILVRYETITDRYQRDPASES